MQRHFTATAFVIDARRKRTLLFWHRRLQRWMPPGGHVDPDETPEETARRECKEETNLDVEIIGDAQENVFRDNPAEGTLLKKPFALLLEEIPDCPERGEPAHQHMDFVYLARPIDETQALRLEDDAGTELRWFSSKEIEKLDTRSEIFANVKEYILSTLED